MVRSQCSLRPAFDRILLRHRLSALCAAVGATVALFAIAPVRADNALGNLLQNGSFEQGTAPYGAAAVPGWQLTGDIDHLSSYWQPSEGIWSLDMNGGAPATIQQSVLTVPGVNYRLTFDIAGNPDSGPTVKTLQATADGVSRTFNFDTTGHSRSVMGWTQKTLDFTATATSTTIALQSLTTGNAGPALDNVFLTNLTQPAKQIVVLNWDADVPGTWVQFNLWGWHNYYQPFFGTTPAAKPDNDFRGKVRDAVQKIFTDAGVTNIEITNTPTDNSTSIYFTNQVVRSGDGYLSGQGLSGLDRFNTDLTGQGATLLSGTLGSVEDVAETTAHEIGHLLGLRHVSPSPEANDIMTFQNHNDRQAELFTNSVLSITDNSSDLTHNPVYHLRRYVNGEPDALLVANNIIPGTWDLPTGSAVIKTQMVFDMMNVALHDVSVLAVYPDGESVLLGQFGDISLDDLAAQSFDMVVGTKIELLAASRASGAIDTILACGDPTVAGNAGVPVGIGTITGFLQTASLDSPSGYVTLAGATVTGAAVPEPSSLTLLAIASARLLKRRRRK
jgi:choice-of-anchor C domain-containing protein